MKPKAYLFECKLSKEAPGVNEISANSIANRVVTDLGLDHILVIFEIQNKRGFYLLRFFIVSKVRRKNDVIAQIREVVDLELLEFRIA